MNTTLNRILLINFIDLFRNQLCSVVNLKFEACDSCTEMGGCANIYPKLVMNLRVLFSNFIFITRFFVCNKLKSHQVRPSKWTVINALAIQISLKKRVFYRGNSSQRTTGPWLSVFFTIWCVYYFVLHSFSLVWVVMRLVFVSKNPCVNIPLD